MSTEAAASLGSVHTQVAMSCLVGAGDPKAPRQALAGQNR